MSLITQCPACSTMFRVVPDQLRISDGWVRCGQCDEVFDANAHLRTLEEPQTFPDAASSPSVATDPEPSPPVTLSSPAPTPMAEPEPEPEPEPAPAPAPAPEPEPYDWGPALSPVRKDAMPEIKLDLGEALAIPAQQWQPEHDPFWEHSPQESRLEPELEGAPEPALAPRNAEAPLDEWLLQQEQEITALRQSESLEQPVDAPPAENVRLSFLDDEATPPWPNRGPGKAILLAFCTLLGLLLGLQLLLSERDHLFATAPALRPLLGTSCELLGCTIAPPRQIDAISIDSSSFTSLKPGVYQLKLTLKNAAAIELATPALELTLTDTQDHPLLRRVVLATEINGQRTMASGAELAASLPISVLPGAVPEKISGYKLLAFYP